ncbi:hypothetical protein HK096_007928 [Nowakowskiella sp. JEL0078]|nr:hypothetical protein HK096_007928 [Nowakowskiella sp. JEL0078]
MTNISPQLRQWVNDKVLAIFGLVEPTLAEFILSTAKSAKSPAQISKALLAGSSIDQSSAALFAEEIFSKLKESKLGKKASSEKERVKETVAYLQKNSKFKLVLSDEEDQGQEVLKSDSKKEKKKEKERKGKLRAREDEERKKEWEEVPELPLHKRAKLESEPVVGSDEEQEISTKEEERLKDQREKEEFAARIKERDLNQRDKKLVQDRSSKAADLETQSRQLSYSQISSNPEKRVDTLNTQRVISRQSYLGKREQQQLLLLEKKIRDEEELFSMDELTVTEKRKLESNRELLRLARERLAVDDKPVGYQMPENYVTEKGKLDKKKRDDILKKRYEEDTTSFVTEQEQWEMYQTGIAIGGSAKVRKLTEEEEDVFDYVFDDDNQIQFILDSVAAKKVMEEEEAMTPSLTEAEKKSNSNQEVRRSIPVFTLRDDLLKDIE